DLEEDGDRHAREPTGDQRRLRARSGRRSWTGGTARRKTRRGEEGDYSSNGTGGCPRAVRTNTLVPAAPADKACTRCDFKTGGGPYEGRRARKKITEPLGPLVTLRGIK